MYWRREAKNATLIGYCVENPLEVFRTAFPDYHVTRFNGYELFGIGDCEPTTPMLGLSISGVESVSGVEKKIEKLLELDEILKAKRDKSISEEDVQRILTYLGGEDRYACLGPRYEQVKCDKEQIITAIKNLH